MNAPAAVGMRRSAREGEVDVGVITFTRVAREGSMSKRVVNLERVCSNRSF